MHSTGDSDSSAVLAALRRPGDEAQLTQVLAAVAATGGELAAAVSRVLLASAPDTPAKRKLGEVPPELICRPEASLASLEGNSHGRVDLRFDSPERDFTLFVELKLHSPYGHDQVGRYRRALSELPQDGRRTGLLAVTRNLPGAGEPHPCGRGWLGSVRWTQVLPGLYNLAVQPAELASQWRLFLDLVCDQGDFGMTQLDQAQVYGWATYVDTRGQLEQLIEDLAGPSLDHLCATLAERDAWERVDREDIATLYTRGKEQKVAYPTQTTVHARFLIPADQGHERLRIQFLGGYDRPFFTVEARRSGSARLLAGHAEGHQKFIEAANMLKHRDVRFDTNERLYWARVHGPQEWLETDTPVAEALLDLVRDDITALADSGILDPDSGFEADIARPAPPEPPSED